MDLEGCSRWSNAERSISRPSGLQISSLQGGEEISGWQEVVIPGGSNREVSGLGELVSPLVEGPSLAGKLSSAEHRGHPSPMGTIGNGKSPSREGVVGQTSVDKGASNHRKKNWIKTKKAGFSYVFGLDIGWEEVLEMSKQTLVGKAMGRRFVIKTVIDWVELNWKSSLGMFQK